MKRILDKYHEDEDFNRHNQLFAPYDDGVLGERFEGGFVIDRYTKKGDCEEIVFDNGHLYRHFFETDQLEADVIPKEYFIHKYIEKCIYDIVVNNSDNIDPIIYCSCNEVEAVADSNPVLVFRAVIDRDNKIVSATNIFIYKQYRGRGFGKQMLKSIFLACKDLGYKLFLTEVVPAFYLSMVKRGATVVVIDDVVEITDKTLLD